MQKAQFLTYRAVFINLTIELFCGIVVKVLLTPGITRRPNGYGNIIGSVSAVGCMPLLTLARIGHLAIRH